MYQIEPKALFEPELLSLPLRRYSLSPSQLLVTPSIPGYARFGRFLALQTSMKNVLIVDDDDFFCAHCVKTFRSLLKDCAIFRAGNGREALSVMQSVPIDFVITDLNMPVMDGYELVAYLNKHYPEVPVMVITGVLSPEVEADLNRLKVFRQTVKPVHATDLIPMITDGLHEK